MHNIYQGEQNNLHLIVFIIGYNIANDISLLGNTLLLSLVLPITSLIIFHVFILILYFISRFCNNFSEAEDMKTIHNYCTELIVNTKKRKTEVMLFG